MTTPRVIEVRRAGNVIIRVHGAEVLSARTNDVPRESDARTFAPLLNGRKRSIAPSP